jgi:hypothetical protein
MLLLLFRLVLRVFSAAVVLAMQRTSSAPAIGYVSAVPANCFYDFPCLLLQVCGPRCWLHQQPGGAADGGGHGRHKQAH